MTAPLNGTPIPIPTFDPELLVEDVAKAMLAETLKDQGPGEEAVGWDDLEDSDRDGLRDVSRAAIHAFTTAIQRMGVRLLPPGAVAPPRTAEEAAVSVQLAEQFFAAQKRKPGLIGSVSPGLVLPRGARKH